MGNRGNVQVINPDGGSVFLYTHWQGSELGKIVKKSLATQRARDRWYDASYLARIIFQDMVGDDQTQYGYGIDATPCVVGELLVLDVKFLTVTWRNHTCTFEEFVADTGFHSSAIQEISYTADGLLKVRFKSSDTMYTFKGVPADVFNRFVTDKSKGKFFAENIRGKYQVDEAEYA
jgi:hypothetical protein